MKQQEQKNHQKQKKVYITTAYGVKINRVNVATEKFHWVLNVPFTKVKEA